MKVVGKRVEMISHFSEDGKINPIKFRFKDNEVYVIVKINKIITTKLEALCGNKMLIFTCSAIVNNVEKIFEIKYDIEGHSWLLYKI